jgi:hypothetical protein
VGFGWTGERKKYFTENPNNFTLKECTIQLEIACTKETKEELFTTDESVPKTRRTLNNFFNLAIISEPIDSWQIVRLDAYNSAPIFNFFSGNFSKVNLDIKNL